MTLDNTSHSDPEKKERLLSRARALMTEAGFKIGMSDGGLVTEAKPNKNGGKYATIGYGDEKNQVQFQLGTLPNELLYCKWGVDNANPKEAESDLLMKLDLTGNAKAFLQKVEQATLRCGGGAPLGLVVQEEAYH